MDPAIHARPQLQARAAAINLGLFIVMSLIWGATWIAIKVGVEAVPPIFFAALRYVLVAAVLVLIVSDFQAPFTGGAIKRTLITGMLVNVGTYSLLFWGMQFVASGVSGLVNLALIPVGLFGLSVLLGDDNMSWRHLAAVLLGVAGLVILFSNKLAAIGSGSELFGAAAIVAATFCYCLGTVMSRPLLVTFTPLQVTAAQAIVGAVGLTLLAVLLEPVSLRTVSALISPAPLAGLLYLVFAGTLAAYSIYLRLVRDWGAPRAGTYAFVSPVVALLLGWLVLDETIGWREVVGAAVMLIAAAIALSATAVPDDQKRDHHTRT
jgi:drug/metabolite transporter (DMT)-like permease